ncbi:MAG TPA: glycine betaine ABC transporter substrate-binding protein [Candidatus Eisenbacteria bacterium]|nr:glycine betaine ABC transporter substrate-binding protein [Candidatus Eisenbacteria bacterium]
MKWLLVLALFASPAFAEAPRVTVGSKAFPESWVLGEAATTLARRAGATAEHRRNLGGTEIVYDALRSGSIDVYPEYTGTIAEVMLHSHGRPSLAEMRAALRSQGIEIGEPLGFNDSYGIAVAPGVAHRLGLRKVSDLAPHPELRLGLTHEFLGRADGWPGLARAYGIPPGHPLGIQHELAYQAIQAGKIDAMDVYTTDAWIERLGLVVLEDDRAFFPRYDAVFLYRSDLVTRAPQALAAIRRLEGKIDETRMIRANARVVLEKRDAALAADSLLIESLGTAESAPARASRTADLLRYLVQHLRLVAISLLAAIVLGVPIGIFSSRSPALARVLLSFSSVVQTIPSLALLAFLIPFLGIGAGPALVALFLYSLLPIVRNTYTGLTTIPAALLESADVLGLTATARLWRIELPMASPAILAGMQTSAVINVGTATLAALIGAGGLGEPILSGIQLRDTALILEGAIPAALLALAVQGAFDLLERAVVPRGLRLRGD